MMYRVSYSKMNVNLFDVGINGYLSWDDNTITLQKRDKTTVTFNLSEVRVNKQLKHNNSFSIKNLTTGLSYSIGFIGTKEGSGWTVSQDYKMHEKEFIRFVAEKSLSKDKNFKLDGTYDIRKQNIIVITLLVVFLTGFFLLATLL